MDPPLRPAQVSIIARFLHAKKVHGAITVGDFNAIQSFDRTLHLDNNLRDAFLEQRGKEDSDEVYTLGQQGATILREQFGCSRMNKVYFTGGLKMVEWKRFGMGVEISEGPGREEVMGLGFDRPGMTDHLGAMVRFEVVQQLVKEEHHL
jgi:tyrosyl-DNA phosphodiesterase 2